MRIAYNPLMPRAYGARKPEHERTRRFKEACGAWASQNEISVAKVFKAAGKKRGVGEYWAKERYYGGTIPSDEDISWARLNAIQEVLAIEDQASLSKHRRAVKKFCYACAGATIKDLDATCWDGGCPLRPISPLPLRVVVENKPIE